MEFKFGQHLAVLIYTIINKLVYIIIKKLL